MECLIGIVVMTWVFLAWMDELFKPPKKKSAEEKFGEALTGYIDFVAPKFKCDKCEK